MFRSSQFTGGRRACKPSPRIEADELRRVRRGAVLAAVAVALVAAVMVPVVPAGAADESLRVFEPDYRMSKQYVAVTAYKILRDHASETVAGCASDVKTEPDRFDDLGAAGAFTRGSINCLDKLGYLEGNLPGGASDGDARLFEPDYRMSKQYVAVTAYKILRDHASGTVAGCASDVKSEPDRFDDLGGAGAFTRGSINCLDKLGYLEGNLPRSSQAPCPTGTSEAAWLDLDWWKQATLAQVQYELRCGADVAASNEHGNTPIHFAAAVAGNVAILQALANAGADVKTKTVRNDTALHVASTHQGNADIIRWLIDAGLDVNARVDGILYTPLHYAASWNHSGIVSVLLEAGAAVNAKTKEWESTPLHQAASNNSEADVVLKLLEAGAEVEARNLDGMTPLHVAAAWQVSVEVVQALLDADADVNARAHLQTDEDWTPLHAAAYWSDYAEDIIPALLDAGADPSARDKWGKTPLDVAKEEENAAAINLLTEASSK